MIVQQSTAFRTAVCDRPLRSPASSHPSRETPLGLCASVSRRPKSSPHSATLRTSINRLQTNPHPKSTFAHPKSTVDLGCEPLIRVENGLRPPPSLTPYRPISTPKIRGFNQTQTVTDQKKFITGACTHCRGRATRQNHKLKFFTKNHVDKNYIRR